MAFFGWLENFLAQFVSNLSQLLLSQALEALEMTPDCI